MRRDLFINISANIFKIKNAKGGVRQVMKSEMFILEVGMSTLPQVVLK